MSVARETDHLASLLLALRESRDRLRPAPAVNAIPLVHGTSVPSADAGRPCKLLEGGADSQRVHRSRRSAAAAGTVMAAIGSAKTIAKPAPEPTCRMSSTGKQQNDV